MSAEHTKHAETLFVGGVKYILAVPWKRIPSEGQELRSIGPHYEQVPVDPLFLYMPDASYVEGISDQPTRMSQIYKTGK